MTCEALNAGNQTACIFGENIDFSPNICLNDSTSMAKSDDYWPDPED